MGNGLFLRIPPCSRIFVAQVVDGSDILIGALNVRTRRDQTRPLPLSSRGLEYMCSTSKSDVNTLEKILTRGKNLI